MLQTVGSAIAIGKNSSDLALQTAFGNSFQFQRFGCHYFALRPCLFKGKMTADLLSVFLVVGILMVLALQALDLQLREVCALG